MGFGAGILLIVIGAILTFAVDATITGIDLKVIGWILMLAGAAALGIFLYYSQRRRVARAVVTERYDDPGQPPL